MNSTHFAIRKAPRKREERAAAAKVKAYRIIRGYPVSHPPVYLNAEHYNSLKAATTKLN